MYMYIYIYIQGTPTNRLTHFKKYPENTNQLSNTYRKIDMQNIFTNCPEYQYPENIKQIPSTYQKHIQKYQSTTPTRIRTYPEHTNQLSNAYQEYI